MRDVESYFVSPIRRTDRDVLWRTFKIFVKAVEKSKIRYFIVGGSLVGSYRHHAMIPWDDDVDVMMDADDKPLVYKALANLGPEYRLDANMPYDRDEVRYWPWKFYSFAGRRLAHRRYRTPYVDLFFYRQNRTHVWNETPWLMAKEVWPKGVVFPLGRRPFVDLTVPSVREPVRYLAGYGVDVTVCETRRYDHVAERDLEGNGLVVAIPCRRLERIFPFVRRIACNGTSVVERLALGDWILSEVTLSGGDAVCERPL